MKEEKILSQLEKRNKNMKPYFTKHIPESGEIKIGDKIRSESHGNPAVTVTGFTTTGDYITDESDMYEYNSYYVVTKDKAQKISKELYICSKVIKPGDKIRCFKPDLSEWVDVEFVEKLVNQSICTFWVIYPEGQKGVALSQNFLKIIGKLSPNVNWIGENHEFDIEELAFNNLNSTLTLGVSVKCSQCKHFH